MLVIGGMSYPDEGSVTLNNESIYDWNLPKRFQWGGASVGFVFKSFNLVPYLNVYENVSVGLSLANRDQL